MLSESIWWYLNTWWFKIVQRNWNGQRQYSVAHGRGRLAKHNELLIVKLKIATQNIRW